ncbi:PE family protein [Mycobacterium shinjukuense]|nr:PE-PPE domain-containing protein [Mycobacterium shinjukuense]
MTVAADVEEIGSTIQAASAAAGGHTTAVMQMAADEVSLAVAALFSQHGRQFQELSAQAAAFHDEFVRALKAAAGAYASSEAANAALTGLNGGRIAAGTASALTSTVRQAAAAAATQTALVMGFSSVPFPSTNYLESVNSLYIQPNHLGAVTQALYTPENLYPTSGILNMTFDMSVAQGVAILDNAIKQQIAQGNGVVVFGYSQSATISTLEMRQLATLPAAERPTTDQLSFVLVANPNNPNGGLFARFDGARLPSLGVTFTGATPHDLYPTTIYSKEYDGYADFPRYPLNLVSTLNALMGIATEHGHYAEFTDAQVESAVQLPTVGDTLTTYYLIPTEHLPLLQPLRAIPVVGTPLADLVEPATRVIVNLGYGDPDYGYSTGPANVPTKFGLFPDISPVEVLDALAVASQQGINQAGADVAVMLPNLWSDLTSGPSVHPVTAVNSLVATAADTINNFDATELLTTTSARSIVNNLIDGIQTTNTDIVGAFTIIAANNISIIQPTAHIALALALTLPSYNLNLFLDGIAEAVNGNPYGLVNAIGYPLAASTTLIALAVFIEGEAVIYHVLLPNIDVLSGLLT